MDRLAYSLGGGKVDDAGDAGVLLEETMERLDIRAVTLHELGALSRYSLDAVEHSDIGVRQIVDDHHVIACGQEFDRGMRPDIAGASGHQYFLFHS